ncbi:MAG: hypothetical protein ABIH23_08345 [bacterium]
MVEKTQEEARKMSEYEQSLDAAQHYAAMTATPGWRKFFSNMIHERAIADEGLHNGEKKDFDQNQARFQSFAAYLKPIHYAVDRLNRFHLEPGELPLFTDGRLPCRATFDLEEGVVEVITGEKIAEPIAKELAESQKENDGTSESELFDAPKKKARKE